MSQIQDMFSDGIYILLRAPNMSGEPYIIKKVTGDKIALRVSESELKLCEEELIEMNYLTLELPELPTVTKEN